MSLTSYRAAPPRVKNWAYMKACALLQELICTLAAIPQPHRPKDIERPIEHKDTERRFPCGSSAPRTLVGSCMSSFCLYPKIRECPRGWSGSGANQQIKICFRAFPTQFVRKPHATTPFRTNGRATQSWGKQLSLGHPTLPTLPSIVQRQAPLLSSQANVHMAAR